MLEKYRSLCEERQKIIVSCDRKSKNPVKHVANNQSGNCVRQYLLDDKTVLDENLSCCDYLVLNCDKKRAYFIELKGRHVLKAKKQIECTESRLEKEIKDFVRFYRIIYRGSTHDVQSSDFINWKKKAGFHRGVPVVLAKSDKYQEQIDF